MDCPSILLFLLDWVTPQGACCLRFQAEDLSPAVHACEWAFSNRSPRKPGTEEVIRVSTSARFPNSCPVWKLQLRARSNEETFFQCKWASETKRRKSRHPSTTQGWSRENALFSPIHQSTLAASERYTRSTAKQECASYTVVFPGFLSLQQEELEGSTFDLVEDIMTRFCEE